MKESATRFAAFFLSPRPLLFPYFIGFSKFVFTDQIECTLIIKYAKTIVKEASFRILYSKFNSLFLAQLCGYGVANVSFLYLNQKNTKKEPQIKTGVPGFSIF